MNQSDRVTTAESLVGAGLGDISLRGVEKNLSYMSPACQAEPGLKKSALRPTIISSGFKRSHSQSSTGMTILLVSLY